MPQTNYQKLVNRAAVTSTLVASFLILLKTIGWLATGSAAMLASLVDSLLDAMTSTINLISLRFAHKPADDDHRFGHGKAEALAALAQGGVIGGSSLFLMRYGLDRLLNATPLQEIPQGLAIMIISIVITLALVAFQRWVLVRTQSVVIKADLLNYQSDVMMNIAIVIALLLSQFGLMKADGMFAVGISFYMLWCVKGIMSEAIACLMDKELPDEERNAIIDLVLAHEQVISLHDVRTRYSANIRFIQIHLELDEGLTLGEAHGISNQVESQVVARFPGSDVIIHLDPASVVKAEIK